MTDKFGDTLLAGIYGRFNKVKLDDELGEDHKWAEIAGAWVVTFNHSDGDVSVLMVSSEETPCDVFLSGARYTWAKLNRWVEKGDIVIANTAAAESDEPEAIDLTPKRDDD